MQRRVRSTKHLLRRAGLCGVHPPPELRSKSVHRPVETCHHIPQWLMRLRLSIRHVLSAPFTVIGIASSGRQIASAKPPSETVQRQSLEEEKS